MVGAVHSGIVYWCTADIKPLCFQVIQKVLLQCFPPTAIRALEAQGLDFVTPYKLDSLKVEQLESQ